MPPELTPAAPPADRTVMATALAPCRLTRHRARLADGAVTTVHVAEYARAHAVPTVVLFAAPEPLPAWCARTGVRDAVVGGFFVTPAGPALGSVWTAGSAADTTGFDPRFAPGRACLHIAGTEVTIAPLAALPVAPAGDLLQAGPALLAGGRVLIRDGEDPEGFSAGRAQFDSDITQGRHPRAALGVDADRLVAVVADGRAPGEAGLTLAESAALMADLGVRDAINLDGGGSASLITEGRLVNRPREADGREIPGGRPVMTAVAFLPRV